MGNRIAAPLGGLGIPIRAIGLDTLVSVPASPGVFDSDFSQAGPQPGTARPVEASAKLQPFLTNAQELDVVVEVTQSGSVEREGVMVSVRGELEADDQERGWIPPTWLRDTSAAVWTAAGEVFDLFQMATIPSTGEVIVVGKRLSDGVSASRLWDPATNTWGLGVDIQAGSGIAAGNHAAVCVLPGDELILAMVGIRGTIYSSADKGASWQLYALEPLGVTLTLPAVDKRDRMYATPNGEVVLFHATSTANESAQYASSDRGASWALVETTTSLGHAFDAVALSDGTLGVLFGSATFARLPSPFDPASLASQVTLPGGTTQNRAMAVDFDGAIYVLGEAAGNPGRHSLWRSKDSGTTWEQFSFFPWAMTDQSALANVLVNPSMTATEGGMKFACNIVETGGTYDGSIVVFTFGGWSNVLGGVGAAGDVVLDRAGFGQDGTGQSGGAWAGIDLPENMGWTLTGTAPTLITTAPEIEFTAASSYETFIIPNALNLFVELTPRVRLAGSLAANEIGTDIILSDGVNDAEVEVNFDGTGFRVRDVGAGTDLATVAVDVSANDDETDYIQVALNFVGRTTLRVWYRRIVANADGLSIHRYQSVTLTTSTLDFTGGVVTSVINWGHFAGGAARTSRWRGFNWVTGSAAIARAADINLLIGKGMGGAGYPIPEIGTALGGSDVAFLGLEAGPGVVGQQYEIPIDYRFGVHNLFADVEPSPDTGWRALNEAEQRLVFDLGEDTFLGFSLFLALLRVQQKTCEIAYAADGAGSFTVLGTFDSAADFSGIDFIRSGSAIRPDAGTAEADRYLFHGEAVGGFVILDGSDPRVITRHTAGRWADPSSVKPEITIETTGGESVSGDVQIVMPDAVLVEHTAGIRARYVQLRFPAQFTARGYIGAGIALAGYLQPMGQLHEWDWASETRLNRDERTSPYGTTRFRELGPPATEWSQNHQSGLDQTSLRASAADDLDYVAPSADLAGLAAVPDVWLLQRGLFEELESGEIVCLSMPAIPDTSGTTLSDRSLWTYGRVSGTVRADGVVGDEGQTELVRVLGPVVEEIR